MELKFNEAKIVRPNHLERCLCYDKFLKGFRCYVYDDISKYWCTQATTEHDPDGENHIVDYADFQVTEWASLSNVNKPSLPPNLDEAAKKAYKEYDVKTAVKPKEHPVGFLFFDGFKAGAEWLAGQFFPRWRNINEDKPKQGEGCACIIVTVNGRIKYSNFEDGPWFWSEKIDDDLLGETEAFIGHNFYGDKEYHTCSHWMPWDEFMGALERMLKK